MIGLWEIADIQHLIAARRTQHNATEKVRAMGAFLNFDFAKNLDDYGGVIANKKNQPK